MRIAASVLLVLWYASPVTAEVTGVKVESRTVVANGQSFGATGQYEKLVGRIEFAIDPADAHNKVIADLPYATKGAGGRVHFSSDLYVLKPVDAARGNGVLFFEISNRGGKSLLSRFNSATGRGTADPTAPEDFGNGYLMREGYTLVWVGWEFDVADNLINIDAPPVTATNAPAVPPLKVHFTTSRRENEAALTDAPRYPPADVSDPTATMTVRDRFWETPTPIARNRWRFVAGTGAPRVALDGGFEPGRMYEVTYRASGRLVAGTGMAAIRDAVSAFRYRTDLPVSGRATYIFGASQSGRFLRDFIHDGFNADEKGRRAFDAIWPHIAGASGGSFNEPFAMHTFLSPYAGTKFPYTDAPQDDGAGHRDGLLSKYTPDQLPKIVYTNTSVEYWGLGRAAALTHTSLDGKKDLVLPDNVRSYLLAGAQHGESQFPPSISNGQQAGNPTPQREVMRALLRGMDQWVRRGATPPASRHPRLSDGTLVAAKEVKFPAIPGVRDPRTITPPGSRVQDKVTLLPHLVSQVDADGNELGGIRVPDQAVPLATTTGWNFRAENTGNPGEIANLAGAYIPFAATRAERAAKHDPRLSVEERYTSRDAYLLKIRAAATALIKDGYLLQEDLDNVLKRADEHWNYATKQQPVPAATAAR